MARGPDKKPRKKPAQRPFVERFYEKTRRDASGCLLWTASLSPQGYGQIADKTGGYTSPRQAHRAAWEMHHGVIPEGLFVCHKCDVRNCVEITHLFLGTCAENLADMVGKGRSPRKADRPNTKLNDEKVEKARTLRKQGFTYREIGQQVGVDSGTVWNALNGKSWFPVRSSTEN